MISSDCSLIVRDLYSYDIKSCYPQILGKQFYDFKNTDLNNKEQRSTFIGKKQIDNDNLSQFLMTSTESLIQFYLLENNISEDEIITTQRDGFIVKKMLDNVDEFIELSYREFIDFLIITPDRQKYSYCSDNKITVKGISHYYESLNVIYQLFSNLNFYDKSVLFDQMENIKNSILYSTNKKLFMVPKDESSFIISTFSGDIEIKDPEYISIDQINKSKYFDHFFKDFLSSLYLEVY